MATFARPRTRPVAPDPPHVTALGWAGPEVLHIPANANTLAGFRAWVKSDEFPEEIRVTFISGEIYLDMSKEELETHVKVKQEVARALLTVSNEDEGGEFYADGPLVSNVDADVSNNPDGVYVSYKSLDAGAARLVPREDERGHFLEIEGTPDWVLEVVSDSSVTKDTKKLRDAYHRAGIREYWVIDAREGEVAFQILHWRKNGYVAAKAEDGWQFSRVFRRWFRFERHKNSRGFWRYQLLVWQE